jgi:hypothetical protein
MGPLVTREHLDKVRGYVDLGVKEGAELVVDGRDFRMQGYENGNFLGGCLFDRVRTDMRIYKEEIFGPVLSVVRAPTYDDAVGMVNAHEYGNGVAIFTRDGDAARTSRTRQHRHGRHQHPDPGPALLPQLRRLEALPVRRPPHPRHGGGEVLHEAEGDHVALADGDQGGGGVPDAGDVRGRVAGATPQCNRVRDSGTDADALGADHDETAALADRRFDRGGHGRQLFRELLGVQPDEDDGRRGGQALLENERTKIGVERQQYARLANREGEDGGVTGRAEVSGADATS